MEANDNNQEPHIEQMVDLSIGHPQHKLLPNSVIEESFAHRVQAAGEDLLDYAEEAGDGAFLESLAQFLTKHYGIEVSAENLFTTGGVSQGIDFICSHFTQPGDIIFVEEPTYYLINQIFVDHDLKIVPIPMKADGIDLAELEKALVEFSPTLLYTIPTFHNPTGATQSVEKRDSLVELAKAHDFMIIADEVYHLLSYGEAPPKPLAAWADSQHVFSVSSFTKILAPGMRLGWIQSSAEKVAELSATGVVVSGGSLNQLTARIAQSAIELGLQDRYIAELKEAYTSRIDIMHETLRKALPATVQWEKPTGGYFFWLTLPEGIDTRAYVERAKALKTGFRPGPAFSLDDGYQNRLRLSFTFYDEDVLQRGVERVAKIIRSMLKSSPRSDS